MNPVAARKLTAACNPPVLSFLCPILFNTNSKRITKSRRVKLLSTSTSTRVTSDPQPSSSSCSDSTTTASSRQRQVWDRPRQTQTSRSQFSSLKGKEREVQVQTEPPNHQPTPFTSSSSSNHPQRFSNNHSATSTSTTSSNLNPEPEDFSIRIGGSGQGEEQISAPRSQSHRWKESDSISTSSFDPDLNSSDSWRSPSFHYDSLSESKAKQKERSLSETEVIEVDQSLLPKIFKTTFTKLQTYHSQLSIPQLYLLTALKLKLDPKFTKLSPSPDRNERNSKTTSDLWRFFNQSLTDDDAFITLRTEFKEFEHGDEDQSLGLPVEISVEAWEMVLKSSYHSRDLRNLKLFSKKAERWEKKRFQFQRNQERFRLRNLTRNLQLSIASKEGNLEFLKGESFRMEVESRSSIPVPSPSSRMKEAGSGIGIFDSEVAFQWNAILGIRERDWASSFNFGKKVEDRKSKERQSLREIQLDEEERMREEGEVEMEIDLWGREKEKPSILGKPLPLPSTTRFPKLSRSRESLEVQLRTSRGQALRIKPKKGDLEEGLENLSKRDRERLNGIRNEKEKSKEGIYDPHSKIREGEKGDLEFVGKMFGSWLNERGRIVSVKSNHEVKRALESNQDVLQSKVLKSKASSSSNLVPESQFPISRRSTNSSLPPSWLLLSILKNHVKKGEAKEAEDLVFNYLKALTTDFDHSQPREEVLENRSTNHPVTKPDLPISGDILLNLVLRARIWEEEAGVSGSEEGEIGSRNGNLGFEKCLETFEKLGGERGGRFKREVDSRIREWKTQDSVQVQDQEEFQDQIPVPSNSSSSVSLQPTENSILILLNSLNRRYRRVRIGLDLISSFEKVWPGRFSSCSSNSSLLEDQSNLSVLNSPLLGNGKIFRILLRWVLTSLEKDSRKDKFIQEILKLSKAWRRGREMELGLNLTLNPTSNLKHTSSILQPQLQRKEFFGPMKESRADNFRWETFGMEKWAGRERKLWIGIEKKLIEREVEKERKEKERKRIKFFGEQEAMKRRGKSVKVEQMREEREEREPMWEREQDVHEMRKNEIENLGMEFGRG